MRRIRAVSLDAISTVAEAFASELERVVFVGGTVTALYPLEDGVDVRPTTDVDCVVDVATAADYYAFANKLRKLGFRERTEEGAPNCRFVVRDVRVDVVATADTAIGPTNRWYKAAVAAAEVHPLGALKVRAIAPIYFVATKLEAFRGRGAGDYQASHDLEDLLLVIAGLGSLRDEIYTAASEVARAVRSELAELRKIDAFVDSVAGHFDGDYAGQVRADRILAWIKALPPL